MRLEFYLPDEIRDELRQRYSQLPDQRLADNLAISEGPTKLRKPRIEEGVSFSEPMVKCSPWR